MSFTASMALREMRSSWRRLVFYFICIALGVGSIVTVRSAIRDFDQAVTSDARNILGADIVLTSTRPWTERWESAIRRVSRPPAVQGETRTIELATMIRPAQADRGGAMMVELKGVAPGYPFYGKVKLEDGRTLDTALLAARGAVVARAVLDRLNLKVGDMVKIGTLSFGIRAVVVGEPGTGFDLHFGPRVLVDYSSVEEAGLAGWGSRTRRRILLKADEAQVPGVTRELRKQLNTNLVRVRSYRDAQQDFGEEMARTENFLSLTGLVILVLGGIGISSVTRVFIEQKRRNIAVLKCLGATGRRVFAAYLLQVLILGLAGTLVGIGLAKAALMWIGSRYAGMLPAGISHAMQPEAVFNGAAVGLLVTLLFSVVPLLRVRRIKPNMLLRDEEEPPPRGAGGRKTDWWKLLAAGLVAAGLLLLAGWQAGSLRVGAAFFGGLAFTTAALYGVSSLLVSWVRRAGKSRSFAIRHGIGSLYRPGNQTRVIVMAVGLGVFFVVTSLAARANLLQDLALGRQASLANMYLIDVQKDQKRGVEELALRVTGKKPRLIPTVRARIEAINGKKVRSDDPKVKQQDRARLGFEYSLTYREGLEAFEKSVRGSFWPAARAGTMPEVSIEESLRGLMGLDVGSTITFDVAGREITAQVADVRRVDWRRARLGFYFVFRPGTAIEEAPHIFIGPMDGPTDPASRSFFERKLADTFPNVTVIDVLDIVNGVKQLLKTVTAAVSFLGGIVFFTGLLILIGSIAMTKFQRIYESAVLKTLGASRRVLLEILTIEHLVLGSVAGLVGSLGSIGLSYALSRWVFEIPWDFQPIYPIGGLVVTALLVAAVGALSSLDVLQNKPLAILKAE